MLLFHIDWVLCHLLLKAKDDEEDDDDEGAPLRPSLVGGLGLKVCEKGAAAVKLPERCWAANDEDIMDECTERAIGYVRRSYGTNVCGSQVSAARGGTSRQHLLR